MLGFFLRARQSRSRLDLESGSIDGDGRSPLAQSNVGSLVVVLDRF